MLPKIYTINFLAVRARPRPSSLTLQAVEARLDDKEALNPIGVHSLVRRADLPLDAKARAQLDTFTLATQLDTYTLRGADTLDTIHVRSSGVRFASPLSPLRSALSRQNSDALDVVDERDEIMPSPVPPPVPRFNSAGQLYRRYVADEFAMPLDDEEEVAPAWPGFGPAESSPTAHAATTPTTAEPFIVDRSADFRFGSAPQPVYAAPPSHDGQSDLENAEPAGEGMISRWSSFSSAHGARQSDGAELPPNLRSRFSSSASAIAAPLRRKGSDESFQASMRTGRTFGAWDQRSRTIAEMPSREVPSREVPELPSTELFVDP